MGDLTTGQSIFVFLLVVAFLVALCIFVPLGFIWAINTLFATGIVYCFETWLAALVLLLVCRPTATIKSNK